MADYTYTRTLTSGVWDINNPQDVDGSGFSVPLAERIEADGTFASKLVSVTLDGNTATVTMNTTLTSGEETQLDTLVSTHQSASGTVNDRVTWFTLSPNGTEYEVYVDDVGALQIV